jgi:hypothetical protein
VLHGVQGYITQIMVNGKSQKNLEISGQIVQQLGTCGLLRDCASGLSDDDDGKNDGLKWKLEESVR